MLIPRTNAEAHLYMDLHPCECGSKKFEPKNRVVSRRDALVSVYEGPCGECEAKRRFEFGVPEVQVAPTDPLTYGGPEPSTILDPGQFLWASDQYAKSAPGNLSSASEAERKLARSLLEAAVACVSEVLKFIPESADAVPDDAFSSPRGKSVRDREPGRFRRTRLQAVLSAYQKLATAAAHSADS